MRITGQNQSRETFILIQIIVSLTMNMLLSPPVPSLKRSPHDFFLMLDDRRWKVRGSSTAAAGKTQSEENKTQVWAFIIM